MLRLKPSNYNLINSHNDIVTGGWASGDKAGYPVPPVHMLMWPWARN